MNHKKEMQKGPSPREAIKNRLPISEMKEPILQFCKEQQSIYLASHNHTEFPDLEVADFRMVNYEMILVLTPASIFLHKLEEGSSITGFIFDKQGHGLKMTKRVYGKFLCEELATDHNLLQTLAETDPMVKKMLTHGAKFYQLKRKELVAYFGREEIFTLDDKWNPTYAEYEPNGKKRYENCRHVLMEYENREVIFNTVIQDGVYYTLTKADSNKMKYIQDGGICQFYDGRDNHFTSKMTILPEERVHEILETLMNCNNAYFKSPEGLVALSYQ
ncbi:MAG: hypothetical protein R3Y67_07705 [Eubacteriales bacterium]